MLARLQQHFGSLAEAWQVSSAHLQEVEGIGAQIVQKVVQERSRQHPAQLLEQHQQKNPNFWTPADADYPRLLLEIPSFPPVLYYQGKVQPQLNRGIPPVVGIVGTRSPTQYGKRWTRQVSCTLAKKGFTIVSGMALGIDTEAHRGCLDGGGRTVAVLGTGVDVVYPPSNLSLYKEIQQDGLVVSEYPAGTSPDRTHFPRRNRIIAGLSRAVLVMEAPTKSGALITANFANEFCRDVYALPGSLDNPGALGCLELLNKGAHLILNEGLLLEMLGAIPPLDSAEQSGMFSPTPTAPLPDLPAEVKQVYEAIASEPTAIDAIVQQAGLAVGTVSAALLQLELLGLVSQLPGMRYERF